MVYPFALSRTKPFNALIVNKKKTITFAVFYFLDETS